MIRDLRVKLGIAEEYYLTPEVYCMVRQNIAVRPRKLVVQQSPSAEMMVLCVEKENWSRDTDRFYCANLTRTA
jgi:hypothetical protein